MLYYTIDAKMEKGYSFFLCRDNPELGIVSDRVCLLLTGGAVPILIDKAVPCLYAFFSLRPLRMASWFLYFSMR